MVETSNVILTALTEFLRNLCNGNGRTATEHWKLGISAVHNFEIVINWLKIKIQNVSAGSAPNTIHIDNKAVAEIMRMFMFTVGRNMKSMLHTIFP